MPSWHVLIYFVHNKLSSRVGWTTAAVIKTQQTNKRKKQREDEEKETEARESKRIKHEEWRAKGTDRLTEGNKKKTRGTNERENREGTQPKILSSKLSLDIFHGCHVIALRDALCKRKRLRSLARYLLSCTHPNIRFLPDMSHRWGDENYHLLGQTGK